MCLGQICNQVITEKNDSSFKYEIAGRTAHSAEASVMLGTRGNAVIVSRPATEKVT
jgi:hypothetical protein